jgi:hypothetical protein
LEQAFTIQDTSADTWRVEVTFGDGTPGVVTNVTANTFSLEHLFPAPGFYPVQFTIRDDDGATGTATLQTIAGAPKLSIQMLGDSKLQLAWTNHPAPFRLEVSSQLASDWHEAPETPRLTDDLKTVDRSVTNVQQSFRLVFP